MLRATQNIFAMFERKDFGWLSGPDKFAIR
jgi:hypothetical protein